MHSSTCGLYAQRKVRLIKITTYKAKKKNEEEIIVKWKHTIIGLKNYITTN